MKQQEVPLQPNWLGRAVLAGFCSTVVMFVGMIVAYGISTYLSGVALANAHGALGNSVTVELWFYNLTHNTVVDAARNELWGALALHGFVGLFWAAVYGYFFEPRLRGNSLERGMLFALLPWTLSLVVFLPLAGGGFFGMALGAGPMPALGNLILHLLYGATLGLVYGPFGDIILEPAGQAMREAEQESMRRAEAGMAKGILVGLLIGFAIGMIGFLVGFVAHASARIGYSPAWFILMAVLMGGALGAIVGSMFGLPTTPQPVEGQRRRAG